MSSFFFYKYIKYSEGKDYNLVIDILTTILLIAYYILLPVLEGDT